MEIPIELFGLFIGISAFIGIIGFMRQPQIPAMLVFGGIIILVVSVSTTTILLGSNAIGSDDIVIYDVPNTLQSADISATGQFIRAEYPSSSSSQLFGKSFDCIEVNLRKVSSPPVSTLVQVGVFNANGDVVSEFGNMNVTNITTNFFFYEFCLPSGEYYTIGSLPSLVERIGIKYNDGDGTNRLQTRFDDTNPFDGTTTFLQSWNGATWSSATTSDLTMILTLRGEDITTVDNEYEFTELPKTLMALIGVIMMLCGALMVNKN